MFRFLTRLFRRRPHGIRGEIHDLERKIPKIDAELEEIEDRFWREGGTCCPGCGVPGFTEKQNAQERRRLRLAQIRAKLARDTTPTS